MASSPIPVFDVGGVLLDWDPRYLYRTLFDDDAAMERFLAEICTPDWNRRMDGGLPFADAVAELVDRHPEHADLIQAYDTRWQEMVPRAFDDTVAVLAEVKANGGPIYAITNFSAEKFALERRRWDFLNWFDGVVVSGEERMLKPDPAIYRRLVETYAIPMEACVFVDDSPTNVEAARRVGMTGIHFTDAAALRRAFADVGILPVGSDRCADATP